MTEPEKQIIKKFIVKAVRKILLADTFADDKFDSHTTLYDLSIFKEADFVLIKRDIAKKFDFNISQDISGLTVIDLYSLIFDHVCKSPDLVQKIITLSQKAYPRGKSEKHPQQQPKANETSETSDVQKKALLNTHQVYAIVLSTMSDVMKRRVFPSERISKIKSDFALNGGDDFDQALMDKLQAEFQVPIQIVTNTESNPKLSVYHIANQTMAALVNCGKAMPPEVEFVGMNPLWIPLYKSMTFDTIVKILLDDFGVWTSTKTISKIESFANFDRYVTTLLIKNKVNKIVFNNGESVLRQSLSDTVISAQDAKSITQNVQNVFNITVDYDISGTQLGQLYRYIYRKTNASKELRYQLFGKTYKAPEPFVLKISPTELNELRRTLFGQTYKDAPQTNPDNIITRADIFAGIIHRINCAVSLGYTVRNYTNIHDLEDMVSDNPEKYNNLQMVFRDLKSIGIEIDTSNELLRIRDVCDTIHNVLIERGVSVSTRVSREDMDPAWGAINPTINFDKLKTVLEYDMGLHISIDKLMNCKTYYDYEKLLFAAKMRKATKYAK